MSEAFRDEKRADTLVCQNSILLPFFHRELSSTISKKKKSKFAKYS